MLKNEENNGAEEIRSSVMLLILDKLLYVVYIFM